MRIFSQALMVLALSTGLAAEPASHEGIYVNEFPAQKPPALTSLVVKKGGQANLSVGGQIYKGQGSIEGDNLDMQTATQGAYSYHLKGKFDATGFQGTLTQQGVNEEKSAPVRLKIRK